MNQFSYRPGTWQLVVESGGIVAVPADVEAARLETLHGMLRDGTPALTDVIDVLAAGSIAALGSFAVALTSGDSIRFAVRGPVQARIVASGDDEVVSGAEVTTWTERFIADARGFELTVDDEQTDAWYPIVSGVVLAATLRQGATAATPAQAADPDADGASAAAGASAPVALEPAGEAVPAAVADAEDDEPAVSEPLVSEPEPEPEVEAEPEPEAESAPEAEPESEAESAPEPELEAASFPGDDPAIAQTLIPADLTLAPMSEGEGIPSSDIPGLGDHDGATISAAELRRLRSQQGLTTEPPTAGPDAPTAVLPVVDSSVASGGHGVARLSTGQVIELDRTVIIGRRPRSTRVSGDSMPHLVAVDSPQQDISRSHLEIRPEGDSVVVIDLRTTNGSTLLRPGADPVRLHPGEHTLVLSGDVVDLGDGVTVAFEGLV
ncbi:FHA domain-containing protein [Microbacterium sp. NPDC089321]|uniref:FHA domain-containing protein n=1 Tax=Microbacterium sp. NPDC089321 TaxID=3155183 RepID=UPI003439DE5B